MTTAPSWRRRGAAFTLVELLVVIGIIAVLLGVLLPALATAREHARRVACLSNLRTLGQAMYMYANVFRDRLPNGNLPLTNDPELGDPVLLELEAHYATAAAVFHCPSDADPIPSTLTSIEINEPDSARVSYDFYSIYWFPEDGPRLSQLKGRAPLAWDLCGAAPPPNAFQNHGGRGGNVVYADGHGAWQDPKEWDGENWPHPADEFYPGATPPPGP